MDKVYIRELAVETVIGVYAWERDVRQTVVLDLEMACDIALAASGDDIAHALDYKAIADRVVAFVEASEFELVETLATAIADLILREFSVSWLRLRLGKPGALANARDVGVIIERGTGP